MSLSCTPKQYMTAVQILSDSEKEVSGKSTDIGHAIATLPTFYESNPFGVVYGDDAKFKAEVGHLAKLCRSLGVADKIPEKYKANPKQFSLWMGIDSNNHPRATQQIIRKRIEVIDTLVSTKYPNATELVYKSF